METVYILNYWDKYGKHGSINLHSTEPALKYYKELEKTPRVKSALLLKVENNKVAIMEQFG